MGSAVLVWEFTERVRIECPCCSGVGGWEEEDPMSNAYYGEPGDPPDEIWVECPNCEGDGWIETSYAEICEALDISAEPQRP